MLAVCFPFLGLSFSICETDGSGVHHMGPLNIIESDKEWEEGESYL